VHAPRSKAVNINNINSLRDSIYLITAPPNPPHPVIRCDKAPQKMGEATRCGFFQEIAVIVAKGLPNAFPNGPTDVFFIILHNFHVRSPAQHGTPADNLQYFKSAVSAFRSERVCTNLVHAHARSRASLLAVHRDQQLHLLLRRHTSLRFVAPWEPPCPFTIRLFTYIRRSADGHCSGISEARRRLQ